MFSPPDLTTQSNLPNNRSNHKYAQDLTPLGSPKAHQQPNLPTQRPNSKHRSRGSHDVPIQHIIPIDEDVKRLFEECEIAKGNAHVLSQALAYARPEELQENNVIQVSYLGCK
jgi:hypothetical protein